MSAEPVMAITTLSLPPVSRLSRTRLALIVVIAVAALAGIAAVLAGSGWLPHLGDSGAAEANAAGLQAARAEAVRKAAARARAKVAAPDAAQGPARAADTSLADDMFAPHSWYIAPPPPPPPPPAAPPEPTAPPFPFTFMGAFTPEGGKTVYFLARGDRVIDAHVGERLDGVYDFESDTAGVLTFNYLPLNIRQPLNSGTH